jgi:hypothetical protein
MSNYTKPTCRGSYKLNSACGQCGRCDEEQKQMDARPMPTLAEVKPLTNARNAKETLQELITEHGDDLEYVCDRSNAQG